MSLLRVERLVVAYRRSEAVKGIDLAVAAGEVVCLLGANGAGKTSTLRALAGLLRPRAGRILLDGAELAGLAAHRIAARGVALVPEGRQIFAGLSVAENLALGAWRVFGAGEIGARRAGVLARFPRLAERLGQSAGSLSGGEQQMLAIGRALMARPRLLLDEPSMGLAPRLVEEIFAIIASLRREGTAVLLVEQNASAALAIADRAYVLETGRIALAGPAAAVAADPAVASVYLGL